MKITKFIKKSKSKYKLILDDNNSITLNEEVVINNNLLVNTYIDKDTLNHLMYEDMIENILSKCINYISVRMRSKKEILNYINKKTDDSIVRNTIIDKLINMGYINDEMFTKSYINDKINLTNYGPYKIKNELKKHDIDENIIDKYINQIDEEVTKNKINKLIEKSIKNNNKYSKNMLISKILIKLVGLGYDRNQINNQLNQFVIENNYDILKHEYEKTLIKLKDKYSGYDLENKIKEKLLQKGYTYDDINKVLV